MSAIDRNGTASTVPTIVLSMHSSLPVGYGFPLVSSLISDRMYVTPETGVTSVPGENPSRYSQGATTGSRNGSFGGTVQSYTRRAQDYHGQIVHWTR